MEDRFQVEKLVTIDAVVQPWSFAKGPAPANVKAHVNYYQSKGGESLIHKVVGGVAVGWDKMGAIGSVFLTGSEIGGKAKSQAKWFKAYDVNAVFQGVSADHAHTFNDNTVAIGRVFGQDVNHDTICYFLHNKVINDDLNP